MKIWNSPEVEEMNLSNTQHGGKVISEFDAVYVNDEGNWEGTFKS